MQQVNAKVIKGSKHQQRQAQFRKALCRQWLEAWAIHGDRHGGREAAVRYSRNPTGGQNRRLPSDDPCLDPLKGVMVPRRSDKDKQKGCALAALPLVSP